MESGLIESLIQVLPPPPPSSETASQRWRRLSGLLKNSKPSSLSLFNTSLSNGYDQLATPATSNQEKFRVAVLGIYALYQFINGLGNFDLDGQDEEEIDTIVDENVPSRYYCYQCHQVVSVNADVEFTCPLCHDGWIQECGGVSLLYLGMPSESEHSASEYDGQGAIQIPHSSQTDIVGGSYGSDSNPNNSPFHTGSHDHNNYDESDQATVYDSNLNQSLLHNFGSNVDTGNNVPGHLGSYNMGLELTLSIDANIVSHQPHHGTRIPTSFWIFSATGITFEAASAILDQVSTPQKPQYSLYGMLLSIVAVLVCILDLIHNAQKQRPMRRAAGSGILSGILPEIFGLALACIQCISSSVQFSYLWRHAANPVKISLVPFLFFAVLFAFKYKEGIRT